MRLTSCFYLMMKLFQAPCSSTILFCTLFVLWNLQEMFSFNWLLASVTVLKCDLAESCPGFLVSRTVVICVDFCSVFDLHSFVSSLEFLLIQFQLLSELPYQCVSYATFHSYCPFDKREKYFNQHVIAQQQIFSKYIVSVCLLQSIFSSYSNFLASSFCGIPQLIQMIFCPQFSVLPAHQRNLNGRGIIFKWCQLLLTPS